VIRSCVSWTLRALDDEPVTPEEEAAVAEVEADRGAALRTIPFASIKLKYSA
jgi:hypothetical protein